MKLMEAKLNRMWRARFVKMLVTNNQPIEYGQALYSIRPNA